MKVFLLAFLLYHINVASTFIVNRIEGVDGLVQHVNFDLNGNIYAHTELDSYTHKQLVKINSTKQVLWTVNFPDYVYVVYTLHINNQDEVFINAASTDAQASIILKKNSEALERYDSSHNGQIVSADKANSNLFYNRDNGVYVIRPNSTSPTPVKYLENFQISTIVFDKVGNAYVGVRSDVILINAFVFISKDALQAEVPYAKFLKVLDDNYNQGIRNLVIDEENNLWIFISDNTKRKGHIKKLSNGTLELIFTDDVHPLIIGMFAKDKIYAVAADYGECNPSIFYITLDNKVVEISELRNLSSQYFQLWSMRADKDGYAYFKSWQLLNPSLGSLVVIKPNEMKPIPIPVPGLILNDIQLDFKDNLWITTDGAGFYFAEKDSTEARLVTIPDAEIQIHLNKVTEEIYASGFNGLYTIAYEN